jgi:hypothetical protein
MRAWMVKLRNYEAGGGVFTSVRGEGRISSGVCVGLRLGGLGGKCAIDNRISNSLEVVFVNKDVARDNHPCQLVKSVSDQ